jgi:hypothetical protein
MGRLLKLLPLILAAVRWYRGRKGTNPGAAPRTTHR